MAWRRDLRGVGWVIPAWALCLACATVDGEGSETHLLCKSDSECVDRSGASARCVNNKCTVVASGGKDAGAGGAASGGAGGLAIPDGAAARGGAGGLTITNGGTSGGGAGGLVVPDGAAARGGFPSSGGQSSLIDVGAPDAPFGWLNLNNLPAAPAYLDWHGEPLSPPGTGGCCTPGDIHWTQEGGGDSTQNRLTRCSYYLHGADHPNEDCIASLSCGGDRVSPTDIAAILNQGDVRAAFTAAPTAFGLATGVKDVITIDGNQVSIGGPCAGTPGCTDAPADLLSLWTALQQLATQQLGWQCSASVDCYAPVDPGPCNGSFPRYGYDVVSGKCQPFTYGGCAGTANRFETLAACQQACKLDPCYAGHPVDAEAGSCIHAGPYCLEDPNAACGCACMFGPAPGETPHQCTASGNVMTCVH